VRISDDDVIVTNIDEIANSPIFPEYPDLYDDTVAIDGRGVTLINAAGGVIQSLSSVVAAIRIEGEGARIVNDAGASIIAGSRYSLAITGSAYADLVENGGEISGQVSLGDGNDVFVEKSASANLVMLDGGDDTYRLETSEWTFFPEVYGDEGYDRFVVGAGVGYVKPGLVSGFEELEIVASDHLTSVNGISGLENLILGAGGDYVLTGTRSPDLTLNFAAANLSLEGRSTIAGAHGEDGDDHFSVYGDVTILGDVDFGGGDDRFSLEFTEAEAATIGGEVRGGDGQDRLDLTVTGEQDVTLVDFTGFETLSLSASPDALVTLRHVEGFGTIDTATAGPLKITASNAAATMLRLTGASTVTIDRTTTLGGLEARGTDGRTTIVNHGVIHGDIALLTRAVTFDSDGKIDGALTGTWGDDILRLGAEDNTIYGGAGNDRIESGAGNDLLDGGDGSDVLIGGNGDDIYVIAASQDTVREEAGQGTDTIRAFAKSQQLADGSFALSYALPDNFERLEIIDTGFAVSASGNGANNEIVGTGWADTLDGKAGADTLSGGRGDDTYVVDQKGDRIVETADGGNDTVRSSITYTLGDNLENIVLSATWQIDATGNDLVNRLTGNVGANVLDGKGGADVMLGGDGGDTYLIDNAGDRISESANQGVDSVLSSVGYTLANNVEMLTLLGTRAIDGIGNAAANTITGNAAANLIDGKAGADTMIGGKGDDTYVVESINDRVTELSGSGSGTDTVKASASYTLGANVEALVLTGSGKINGTGNADANTITGNAAANLIDGQAGADTMIGGKGDDTYVVDNAKDRVTEIAAGGTDTVQASIGYVLGANVEKLVLTGNGAINGTGNGAANTITGNIAANVLDGKAGGDTLIGGRGDDIYIVDNAQDRITELTGGGTDTVKASLAHTLGANVEKLVLTGSASIAGTGNALGNILTGNTGKNALSGLGGDDGLIGGGGDDRLTGGAGRDTLTGGAGADRFVFAKGDSGAGPATADRIVDFSHNAHDRIDLGAIDARVTGPDNAFSFIGTKAFGNVAGQLRYEIGDHVTLVSGDTNGDGRADFMIQLDGAIKLVAADFIL
jgi:Ca2+-binding RTX toxin-like protein